MNLPAIATRSETYDLGGGRTYTRLQGELLHPAHESVDTLIELKREMGPIAFSAQYQQAPIPPGGTIIKRKWLTTYDHVGIQPGDRIVISWDIALSEMETGDYSACVVLLIRNEVFFILEVVRGRFPFETLKRKIMDLKKRYHPSTLLIEESPISLGLIQSLREQSINVTTYKPDTDKRARLIAQTDLFAGGSVRLPQRASWLEEFVAELLAFPGGHDDQVDALTQGLAWGRQSWSRRARVSALHWALLGAATFDRRACSCEPLKLRMQRWSRLDFAAEESVHAAHDMTGNASVIALARPLRRALGGGSAGIGPAYHHGGSHVQVLIPNRQAQRHPTCDPEHGGATRRRLAPSLSAKPERQRRRPRQGRRHLVQAKARRREKGSSTARLNGAATRNAVLLACSSPMQRPSRPRRRRCREDQARTGRGKHAAQAQDGGRKAAPQGIRRRAPSASQAARSGLAEQAGSGDPDAAAAI